MGIWDILEGGELRLFVISCVMGPNKHLSALLQRVSSALVTVLCG